jgi:putative membrane protein insertion efficiency factor
MIRIYQVVLSPFFPAHCRYWPTCSGYARQAVRKHGARTGAWLALRRIARCHPWGGYGYDPVPDTCHEHENSTNETTVTGRMEQGV